METDELGLWITLGVGALDNAFSEPLLPHVHAVLSNRSAEGAPCVAANDHHSGAASLPAQCAGHRCHTTLGERF